LGDYSQGVEGQSSHPIDRYSAKRSQTANHVSICFARVWTQADDLRKTTEQYTHRFANAEFHAVGVSETMTD
jgi:hypothetical protein